MATSFIAWSARAPAPSAMQVLSIHLDRDSRICFKDGVLHLALASIRGCCPFQIWQVVGAATTFPVHSLGSSMLASVCRSDIDRQVSSQPASTIIQFPYFASVRTPLSFGIVRLSPAPNNMVLYAACVRTHNRACVGIHEVAKPFSGLFVCLKLTQKVWPLRVLQAQGLHSR